MVKVIDNRVDLVNGLIRKSFGEGFVGNCTILEDYDSIFPNLGSLHKTESLNTLAKEGTFSHLVAGEFLSQDGSSLKVYPKYSKEAVIYAELFERETSKEITISYFPNNW